MVTSPEKKRITLLDIEANGPADEQRISEFTFDASSGMFSALELDLDDFDDELDELDDPSF